MKKILLLAIFFAAGFLSHAFFFPDVLVNVFTTLPPLSDAKVTQSENEIDPLITKIYFDGQRFSRNNVSIGFTRYIQIINSNEEKLMSLVSSEPALTTPRGYGYTEAVKMQFNKKGQFVVADKNNPQERLVITVK